MRHDDLVSTFGQTVGIEKAEALVAAALETLGIERKEAYSSHEIADICETIGRKTDGYLRVVANEIRVREQAKRRFDALLDRITDPVVTVSFAASEPTVTAVNPAFESTFGYGEDAIGQSLPELIVPEDERAETVDDWVRSDADCGTEVERVTADGDRRTFLFRPVVVSGFDGEVEGFGIYTDITARKRRERTLERQNEQLERFVSVVSHDLRNPLSVAQGNATLARERTSEPAVDERLEQIIAAHERMEDLIDDLLTLARQGQTVDDPVDVQLGHVLRSAWRTVDTKRGRLLVEPSVDRTVDADQGRLRQLFENLFRNALEHAAPDGDAGSKDGVFEEVGTATGAKVNIGTGNGTDGNDADHATADGTPGSELLVLGSSDSAVTVRVGWDEDEEALFVEDDGPGIPDGEHERIFEHGYTTSADGTGFGLAIVQAIAEAHDWTVEATDAETGGARFTIRGLSVRDAPE